MADEQPVLVEVFDISRVKGARAKWPKENKKVHSDEISHPPTTLDLHDGPFEPLDGWKDEAEGWTDAELASLRDDVDVKPTEQSSFRVDSPGETPESSKPGEDTGVRDEEIGYEGER